MARATQIREARVWFGLYEWLVFCKIMQQRTRILFGSHLFDVCAVCGGMVPELRDLRHDRRGMCAVACLSSGLEAHETMIEGRWVLHHDHWQVGLPTGQAVDCDAGGNGVGPRPAKDATLDAGFHLIDTPSDGECGPASMLLLSEQKVSEGHLCTFRSHLADVMAGTADDKNWHEAWNACAEQDHAPLAAKSSSAPGSGSAGGSVGAPDHGGIALQIQKDPVADHNGRGVRPRGPCVKVDGAGAVVLPRLPVKKSTPSKETLEQNSAPPVEDDQLVQAIRECAGSRTGRLPGFERWLLSLTEGERAPILRNITSRTAAKRLWNAYKKKRARECEADPLPQGADKKIRSRPVARRYVRDREALVEGFLAWTKSRPSTSFSKHGTGATAFLRSQGNHTTAKELDADRKSLERALKTYNRPGGFSEVHAPGPGRRRRTLAEGRCLNKHRTRLTGSGYAHYGGLLGEELFQWFVDKRHDTACRLRAAHVMAQARKLADQILQASKRAGVFMPMPTVDDSSGGRSWFRRWCHYYGVCMRQPTVRHKCSFDKCCMRLHAMWCNVIRVRALAQATLGRDLDIEGIDQKGIHKNEVGSKNGKTLSFEGTRDVPLKENVSATRERMSIMTLVRSRAQSYRDIPLEIMFKSTAKTPDKVRLFQGIEMPTDMKLTLVTAPKGSYREEHVLGYLYTWLEPWSPQREAANDYRGPSWAAAPVKRNQCGGRANHSGGAARAPRQPARSGWGGCLLISPRSFPGKLHLSMSGQSANQATA